MKAEAQGVQETDQYVFLLRLDLFRFLSQGRNK